MGGIIAASDIVGGIFMIMILAALLQQKQTNSSRSRFYILLLISDITGLFLDAASYCLECFACDSTLLIVTNSLTFILTNVCIVFFAFYVISFIREKWDVSYLNAYIVIGIAVINTLLVIIGVYTGNLFTVKDGRYIYGEWRNYISVIPVLIIVWFFMFTFSGIKKLGKKQALLLSTFLIFPLVMAGLLLFLPHCDFSYLAIALSCFLIFIFIQNEVLNEARSRQHVSDEADKVKTLFLSSMSHEIRTPINTVLGMDEMILRESNDAAVREYAMDIWEASQTLLSIINDILDLGKIKSGRMEIVPEAYDVSSMIFDISNMIRFWAEEKGLYVDVSVSDDIPSRLLGDDVRIRQILVNLLTNAIKYTPKGTVWLRIVLKTDSKDITAAGDEVILHFEVEDTGIGMKTEDVNRLFSEYRKIDDDHDINSESTGLGMPITLKLLNMMGSELEVKSEYGRGSVFGFDLKQKVIDKAPVGDFEKNIKNLMNTKSGYTGSFEAPDAHILVVDDNAMNRKVFVSLIKSTRIMITEAADGQEAVDLASKQHYDIIFMDHMMPGMDGVEAMKRIKAEADGPCVDTPIIVLTANAVAGVKEKYDEYGFDGYMSKPVAADTLEKIIKDRLPADMIRPVTDRKAAPEPAASKSADNEEFPVIFGIDWKMAMMRLQSRKILDMVLKEFEMTIGQQADKLQGYRKDFPEALESYKILVHGLKSASASVGIIPLAGTAALLEKAAANNDVDTIDRLHEVFIKECRNYKLRLREYLHLEDEEEDKDEINNVILRALLRMLASAMADMDIEKADGVIEKMSSYKLPDKVSAEFDNLKAAVSQLDQDMVTEILSRIEKS
ncbi:MAG: response regulator [Lachnospiraceae bacterium]|nr:response regulator [Lachnospiraceae bacterium]